MAALSCLLSLQRKRTAEFSGTATALTHYYLHWLATVWVLLSADSLLHHMPQVLPSALIEAPEEEEEEEEAAPAPPVPAPFQRAAKQVEQARGDPVQLPATCKRALLPLTFARLCTGSAD